MKGFGIEIKNDLLDPQHIEKMGVAVWLYMWFIDKMTSISEEGIGLVLGGKPIKYAEVRDELGITERTYSRWVSILAKESYVNAKRTPYGLVFSVNKAFKRFGKRTAINGASDKEGDTPEVAHRPATSGVSNTPHMADVIKTVSVDSTEDMSVRVAEAATAPEATPGEYTREFFGGNKIIVLEVANWALERGYQKRTVLEEILKFKNYWTEPTRSGRKQRWETQPTFEVKRRLLTWLARNDERATSRRSGAGVTVT